MSESAAGLACLVLEQVGQLLSRLEPGQLRDLAEGRARLAVTIVPAQVESVGEWPNTSPIVPAIPTAAAAGPAGPAKHAQPNVSAAASRRSLAVDVGAARAEIMGMSSRDEAAQYVEAFGTVAALRSLAAGLGVRLTSKDRKKADIARKIVDATLGVELTARAIRGE